MNRQEEMDRVLQILSLDADSENVNVHLRTHHSLVEFGPLILREEVVELMEFLGPDSDAEIGPFGDSKIQLQWSSSDPDIYCESDDDARHSALCRKREEETRVVLDILGVAEAEVSVLEMTDKNEVRLDFGRVLRSFTYATLKNLAAFLGHEDFSCAPYVVTYRPVTAPPWGSEEALAEENSATARAVETRMVLDAMGLGGPGQPKHVVTHGKSVVKVVFYSGIVGSVLTAVAKVLGHQDFIVDPLGDSKTALTWATNTLREPKS